MTILGYIKFNKKCWLEQFCKKELSFSCADNFIKAYDTDKNADRNDPLEAVFARVKRNDIRIKRCKERFQNDLQIIDDGDYVYLRRKSSCRIPIFCLYGITEDKLTVKESDQKIKFTFTFPDEMYKGFSDDDKNCSVFVQALPFNQAVEKDLSAQNIKYTQRFVDYSIRSNDEFYIEPTDEREELFYKFPSYSKQNEVRIILPHIQLTDQRINYTLPSISPDDIHLIECKVRMVIIAKKKKHI